MNPSQWLDHHGGKLLVLYLRLLTVSWKRLGVWASPQMERVDNCV